MLALKTGRTALLALVLVKSSLTGASASVSAVTLTGPANLVARWVERALDAGELWNETFRMTQTVTRCEGLPQTATTSPSQWRST